MPLGCTTVEAAAVELQLLHVPFLSLSFFWELGVTSLYVFWQSTLQSNAQFKAVVGAALDVIIVEYLLLRH